MRDLLCAGALGTLVDIDVRIVIDQPWHNWIFMLVIRGAAKGLGEERRIEAPATWLNDLLRVTRGESFLPSGIWAVIALSVLIALLLRYTRLGRHVFAIGSNERMAGNLGFEYQVVEGLWRRWTDDQLRELVTFSKERHVGILLWVHSRDIQKADARRELFQRLHGFGVAGVKIDFFDHDLRLSGSADESRTRSVPGVRRR